MKIRRFLRRIVAGSVLSLALATPVSATIVHAVFGYGNVIPGALATGYADFDAANFLNPTPAGGILFVPVLRLLMVITGDSGVPGSPSVNGTYDETEFPTFAWYTAGATLDFSRELVGQHIVVPGLGPCQWGLEAPCGVGDFTPIAIDSSRFSHIGHFLFTVKDRDQNFEEGFHLGSVRVFVIPEPGTLALLSLSGLILAGSLRRRGVGK